jgi:hypothetical protein
VKPTPDYRPHCFKNISVAGGGWNRLSRRARRRKEKTRIPETSYAETADLDSICVDEDRAPLVESTQTDQVGRYAEILWLEQKLIGPLRPHKEDRLRKVLANTEAVYEAQWIELEMAVGSRAALKVRRRVEAQQEPPLGRAVEPVQSGQIL